MRAPSSLAVAAVAAAVLCAVACRRAGPPTVSEVVVVTRGAVPADPGDPVWRDAPVHVATLILQDMVEPRLMQASTSEVRVQAVADGARVAFRLEWPDGTRDDLPQLGAFTDACAVQLPSRVQADVPAPQMGEAGRAVEITYWRASWQAVVDGRGDTIRDLYPNASVDHYPFEAASLPKGSQAQGEMASRYAPARLLANRMAGPRERSVEDLIAEGPGTILPAPVSESNGKGRRSERGWAVVLPPPRGPCPGGTLAGRLRRLGGLPPGGRLAEDEDGLDPDPDGEEAVTAERGVGTPSPLRGGGEEGGSMNEPPSSAAGLDPRVRELLREAADWRLIGLLFERPRGDWWSQVASLARGCDDPDLEAAARAAAEATEGAFLAVLGPGGPVSAREAGHRETADPGHVLADVGAFYRAFAFEPTTEEPPDHVSVEAAFVGYLRLKEAYALARGDAENAVLAREAASRFLETHLSSCAEPIARALARAEAGYLASAAEALLRRAGPRPKDLEGG